MAEIIFHCNVRNLAVHGKYVERQRKRCSLTLRGVWRYQRGNQNPYIEEEQTTQWPKEKVQKDKTINKTYI